MRNILFIILALFIFNDISAQELACRVSVNSRKLTNLDQKIFQTMRQDISEFLNNRTWTEDTYETSERIECSININFDQEVRSDRYRATVTIQASRPVFNSSYKTLLLNHSDRDWEFEYVEFQPLEYSDNANLSNLTSMLAFYAYLIIGLDYDSYSLNGGSEYLTKAQTIVNNISSNADAPGWSPIDGNRNRYWIIENLMNSRYSVFRSSFYTYHRQGLDRMYDKTSQARQSITSSITALEKITREYPNSMIIQSFFDAKSNEIKGIYREATPAEKSRIISKLIQMDPRNSEDYEELMNQGGNFLGGSEENK